MASCPVAASLLRCRDRLLADAKGQSGYRRPRLPAEHGSALSSADTSVPGECRVYHAARSRLARSTNHGGHGYDLIRNEIVDVAEAGILDVARVQIEALQRAVSSAALALTIDVLVLHREPETMTDP